MNWALSMPSHSNKSRAEPAAHHQIEDLDSEWLTNSHKHLSDAEVDSVFPSCAAITRGDVNAIEQLLQAGNLYIPDKGGQIRQVASWFQSSGG